LDEASSPLPKTAILRSIASRPSQTGQYLIGLDGVDVGAELPDLNRGVADIRLVRRDQKIVPFPSNISPVPNRSRSKPR
jgi:hypothetical protein